MNQIGSIQAATQPGLKNHQIHILASEIVEGERCGNLEKRWMAFLINEGTYPPDTPNNVRVVDWSSVDLDSLVKPDEVR